MPHDINGKIVEEGDLVVAKHYIHGNKPTACTVLGVLEGSDTCNLFCQSVKAPFLPPIPVTAKEAELLLKRDGSKPS